MSFRLRRGMWMSSAAFGALVLVGADLLLSGETDGMASDFTESTGAGYVSVKDTATPGNVVSNVSVDSWWGNAGTSPKLVTGSDGVLRWSPHNLALQSNAFGTTWTNSNSSETSGQSDPDGGTSAWKLHVDTTAGIHRLLHGNITVIAGATYTLSIRAKAGEHNWFAIDGGAPNGYFNLATGEVGSTNAATSTITPLGNGWYLCTITFVAASSTADIRIYVAEADNDASFAGANTTDGLFIYRAQLNRGTVPTAYLATTTAARFGLGIDYDGSSYGLLVEPAATNLALRSQEFDNAEWNNTAGAITANDATAPDGTTTADKEIESGANLLRNTNAITITSAAAYRVSVYVKRSNIQWFRILAGVASGFGDSAGAFFDIQNGVVGSTTTFGSGSVAASPSITALGNGWYRCEVTITITGSTTMHVAFNSAVADASATRVTTGTFWIWGAQVELGTVATSPISTFAATVTRAADNVNKVLTALPFSATLGTVYADYLPSVPTGTQVVWHIDDGTGNERIYQYRATSDPAVAVIDGGVNQLAPLDLGTITGGARSQTTFAWKANDFAGSHDGGAIVADTSGTLPTMTTFRLGTDQGTAQLNGRIRKVVWVPRRVIDADLPTWRYVAP